MAMILAATMVLGCSVTASAAEIKETKETISVYDGSGQYIGEFDSLEEFEREYLGNNGNQRSGLRWVLKILKYALETYDVLEAVKDFTGIDVNGWISAHVVLPAVEGVAKFRLYSVSGGITNPYPPNSYQYHQFDRTNYYWVQE